MTDTVLLAYDGSDPARHAIAEAGRLFGGRDALVVTVWTSVRDVAGAARAGMPDGVIEEAVHNLDAAAEQEATETAEEGARLAGEAGLSASALVACAQPSIWATLVHLADERDVAAVVVGSRGRSALASTLLGSVSSAVVHHSRRPVVVVHPHRG